MKHIIFILAIATVMFAGCNNRTNTDTKTNVVVVDSIALKKTELIINEGIKAIGNIDFYISEQEFKKQQKIFLQPLIRTVSLGSAGSYNDGYIIGEYKFNEIKGTFFNDSLFNVHIWGNKVDYDTYNTQMKQQYDVLLQILEAKYGLPEFSKPFPDRSTFDKVNILAEWDLDFKKIIVVILRFGLDYRLDFSFYVPEMAERNNKAKQIESDKKNTDAVNIL